MISIIYGTRPEFLKLKTIISYLYESRYSLKTRRDDLDIKDDLESHRDDILFNIIRINQHNNIDDNNNIDYELDIDENNNDNNDNRLSNIGSSILVKLPNLIKNSTHILIQGDTASCFYSALCAYQMDKKIIHLEAGMRTYDLLNPFPEEGYRQMITRLTNIHLCPSVIEKNNILKELISDRFSNGKENIIQNIYIVGNTILDLVKSYNIKTSRENKVLITLHRRENWNLFKNYLIELIKLAINKPTLSFYFILHPNPSFKTIWNDVQNLNNIPDNIFIKPPISHKELIELLSTCNYVITDSGGIQEEANFLGKHIYVFRKQTERSGIKNITLCSLDHVSEIKDTKHDQEFSYEYGTGESTIQIINIIKNI